MLSEIWHALAVASMNASNNFLAIHLTMYCSSHAVLTVSVCLYSIHVCMSEGIAYSLQVAV